MKQSKPLDSAQKHKKAIDPEARQDQMVALAVDLAEQQLRDGTASSQVITHFLKLGTATAKLEEKKLEAEVQLVMAKKEALQSAEELKQVYSEALKAFQIYSGQSDGEEV